MPGKIDEENPTYNIRAISRAVQLLKCFSLERTALTLGDMSEMLNLHKSTVHRIVKTLEAENMLVKNPVNESYSLGLVVFQLGNVVRKSLDLRNVSLPVMKELANATGETVLLNVLSGWHKVCIEKVNGARGLRPTIQVGQILPAHAGSSGKALLAYLEQNEIMAIAREVGLPSLTPSTITNVATLTKELALVKQRGFAIGFEETTVGGAGVSAPIVGYSGKVMASLSVVGSAEGIKAIGEEKLADMVVSAAKKISGLLGSDISSLVVGEHYSEKGTQTNECSY